MTEKKNYALPIAMMYLLFFMIAFVTNLCNPMAVIVKNQFDVSNAMPSWATRPTSSPTPSWASLPAYCLKR